MKQTAREDKNAQEKETKGKGDVVEKAARTARFVVHVELAYDVLDEMASNPERYIDSLYKLSRLATKVLNDLDKVKVMEKGEDDGEDKKRDRKIVEYARKVLRGWAKAEKELVEYLNGLRDNPRELKREVKRFAALSIAPDYSTLRLKEIMERGWI